jgi:hypothetical protein
MGMGDREKGTVREREGQGNREGRRLRVKGPTGRSLPYCWTGLDWTGLTGLEDRLHPSVCKGREGLR